MVKPLEAPQPFKQQREQGEDLGSPCTKVMVGLSSPWGSDPGVPPPSVPSSHLPKLSPTFFSLPGFSLAK